MKRTRYKYTIKTANTILCGTETSYLARSEPEARSQIMRVVLKGIPDAELIPATK